MVECCGKELTTLFCPHCGKRSHFPLMELLQHCRNHATYRQERVKLLEGSSSKSLKRSVRIGNKWAQWADALESILNPPPPSVEAKETP